MFTLFRILFLLLVLVIGFKNQTMALSVTPGTKTPVETLKTLIQTDQLIVLGTVGTSSSFYVDEQKFPDAESIIMTDTLIKVEKVLKGTVSSETVTVKYDGGCILEDDICSETETSPKFSENEKVILFLNPSSDKKWIIWDFLNGKQILHQGIFYPLGLTLKEIQEILERS